MTNTDRKKSCRDVSLIRYHGTMSVTVILRRLLQQCVLCIVYAYIMSMYYYVFNH